ncbi:uncharacterized protein LOC114574342 [Exaiptasia diaphana]|uniref:Uncharacterized protein n=1 Tax=Exaiptasia diaphana TaxID=2652724 RepID=A0A913YBV7_EXADI|nr:uncharacterized protein LOC114574342 [Exaiptasia diaphana]
MKAWKAKILGPISLSLENCNPKDLEDTSELLLFVSRADASDYGKYDIVRVKEIINCTVILHTSIKLVFSGSPCEIIAQRFPNFNKVTLTQSCTLTCNARLGVVGGVMAFRAVEVQVDSTSKIEMNGKGK